MIFSFFFLKFYNGILKSSVPDHPRFGASLLFGLFANLNIFEISSVLSKLNILPFIYSNKTIATISTPIIVAIIFLLYKNSRIESIKTKIAEEEFKPKKKTLNIAFILYLVFTILIFVTLPWWKPGYLP